MRRIKSVLELLKEIKKKVLNVEKILEGHSFAAYYTLRTEGRARMERTVDNEHRVLRELILYVANRLSLHPKFGATKLNKILFYSDFRAYAELGEPITGEIYWRLPRGPAPRFFVQTKTMMIEAKEITPYSKSTLSGPQHRIAPLRPPVMKEFTSEQISIVEQVIEELKDKDAYEVSELSHEFIGWKIVRERQDIPYQAVFLRDPETITITERHRRIAEGIAKRNEL